MRYEADAKQSKSETWRIKNRSENAAERDGSGAKAPSARQGATCPLAKIGVCVCVCVGVYTIKIFCTLSKIGHAEGCDIQGRFAAWHSRAIAIKLCVI